MRLIILSAALAFSTAIAVPLSETQVGFYSELDLTNDDTYSLEDPTGVAIAQNHKEPEVSGSADVSEESDLSPRQATDECSVDDQNTFKYPTIVFDDGKTAIKTGHDSNGIPYTLEFMKEIANLGLASWHPIFKSGRTQGAMEIEVMMWLDRFAKRKLAGKGYNFYRTFTDLLNRYKTITKQGRQHALVAWYRSSHAMARMAPGPEEYVLFDTRPAIKGGPDVTIFDPIAESGSDPGPGQVFAQAELPALMRNKNVKRIIAVRKVFNIFSERLQWDVDAPGAKARDALPMFPWDDMDNIPDARKSAAGTA